MASGTDFAGASSTLAAALLAATSDPADAIRLLIPLAGFVPDPLPGRGPLAALARQAQDALAANLRASACAVLARAAQRYQPLSYQDAQAVRAKVCAVLDREATRSADAQRDATYAALRALCAAVALDLAVRGANLAALVEVSFQVSMPSLAAAWTLYQDTTREPELVRSADVAHPLFLPLSFSALAR